MYEEKNEQNHKSLFRTLLNLLNILKQRRVISEKWKKQGNEPYLQLPQLNCMVPGCLSELRRWNWEYREAKMHRISGQKNGEEKAV